MSGLQDMLQWNYRAGDKRPFYTNDNWNEVEKKKICAPESNFNGCVINENASSCEESSSRNKESSESSNFEETNDQNEGFSRSQEANKWKEFGTGAEDLNRFVDVSVEVITVDSEGVGYYPIGLMVQDSVPACSTEIEDEKEKRFLDLESADVEMEKVGSVSEGFRETENNELDEILGTTAIPENVSEVVNLIGKENGFVADVQEDVNAEKTDGSAGEKESSPVQEEVALVESEKSLRERLGGAVGELLADESSSLSQDSTCVSSKERKEKEWYLQVGKNTDFICDLEREEGAPGPKINLFTWEALRGSINEIKANELKATLRYLECRAKALKSCEESTGTLEKNIVRLALKKSEVTYYMSNEKIYKLVPLSFLGRIPRPKTRASDVYNFFNEKARRRTELRPSGGFFSRLETDRAIALSLQENEGLDISRDMPSSQMSFRKGMSKERRSWVNKQMPYLIKKFPNADPRFLEEECSKLECSQVALDLFVLANSGNQSMSPRAERVEPEKSRSSGGNPCIWRESSSFFQENPKRTYSKPKRATSKEVGSSMDSVEWSAPQPQPFENGFVRGKPNGTKPNTKFQVSEISFYGSANKKPGTIYSPKPFTPNTKPLLPEEIKTVTKEIICKPRPKVLSYKEKAAIKNKWIDEKTEYLVKIFPDADPTFLRAKCVEMDCFDGALERFVRAKSKFNDMPTRADYEKRLKMKEFLISYTKNFVIEDFLMAVPEPWVYYSKPGRDCSKYKHLSLAYLKSSFRRHAVKDIGTALKEHKYNLYLAYTDLKDNVPEILFKSRVKKDDDCCLLQKSISIDAEFAREVAFIENEHQIIDYLKARGLEKDPKSGKVRKASGDFVSRRLSSFDNEVLSDDTDSA